MIDRSEFEDICKLRDNRGHAIGPGVATKLFPVRNPGARRDFLRLWQKNAWSARELENAVSQKHPKLGDASAGRKPKLPKTKEDALQQLGQMTQRWLRWYEQMSNPPEDSRFSLDQLAESVRADLVKATNVIRRLHKSSLKLADH